MYVSCKSRWVACCVTLVALGSLAHAQDPSVISYTDKHGHKSTIPVITAPDAQALNPVPEPSAGSLILFSLGGIGLALKLRKRA